MEALGARAAVVGSGRGFETETRAVEALIGGEGMNVGGGVDRAGAGGAGVVVGAGVVIGAGAVVGACVESRAGIVVWAGVVVGTGVELGAGIVVWADVIVGGTGVGIAETGFKLGGCSTNVRGPQSTVTR